MERGANIVIAPLARFPAKAVSLVGSRLKLLIGRLTPFLTPFPSGPDAGQIEFSIDGGNYRSTDTFTRWSTALHLPWAVILDDGLKDGAHTVKVRIAEGHNSKGNGTALRVFHLLLN